MKVEFVSYNGRYPTLCSGELIIQVDNITWRGFELISGGRTWFDDEWSEHIEHGEWKVRFPNHFPEEGKQQVIDLVNEKVPYGCCGGCI